MWVWVNMLGDYKFSIRIIHELPSFTQQDGAPQL
jgi:hypothetical protein